MSGWRLGPFNPTHGAVTIPLPPYMPVAMRPMLFGDLYAGTWVTMANDWARQAWVSGELEITGRW